jgi:sec-independent protein translocase protein TatC
MFLLKKIFQLREKGNPDHEKPFLEHLEDLRIMITRVVATLTIATVVCFIFRDQLMEVIRRPVEEMREKNLDSDLPDEEDLVQTLDGETWEHAKETADALAGLSPEDRAVFFQQCGDEALRFHVETVYLYRAAFRIPEEKRTGFLDSLANLNPELRKQVTALLETGPSPIISTRSDLRMMGAFNPTEAFMLSIKLAFFAGIVVSFPLLLLFVLQFVLPGLHEKEKRAMWPAMAIGFGLFLIGVFFAYFAVLPRVLEFFHNYAAEMGIANEWRIGYYISFATQFTLIFGLAFELPVVVMTLVKIGILSYDTMKGTRSYAVLAIFVIAAVITPTPDAFTLCLLAVPMVFLYEICIWLAWWMNRKEAALEEEEEKEELQRLLDAREHDHDDDELTDELSEAIVDEPTDDLSEAGEQEDTGDPLDSDDDPEKRDIDPFTEYEDPYADLYDDPYADSEDSGFSDSSGESSSPDDSDDSGDSDPKP